MKAFKSISKKKAWILLGLFALEMSVTSFIIAPAYAQSSRDLQNRISRLENEIETLNRAIYRGERPPAGAGGGSNSAAENAQTEVRLQQMEMELRELRGKIEEQGYEVGQISERLDRALADMDLRMQELERKGVSTTGASQNNGTAPIYNAPNTARDVALPQDNAPSARPNGQADDFSWSSQNGRDDNGQLGRYIEQPQGRAAPLADSAAAAYEQAFSLLKAKRYEDAARQFQSFVDQNPSHPLSSNAYYWLGESYYVREQFQDAARVFAEAYQNYPEAGKAPDSLLKLGMSLAAMGSTEDACVALEQLSSQYGNTSGPATRRGEQEIKRLGC